MVRGLLLALALWQDSGADLAGQGRKALDERNYALAAECFEKILAAEPKDWSARFHLALAQSLLDKDDLAIANYRQVLAEQAGLYQAQVNLGVLLLRRKQAGEAIPLLEAAAAQKPKEFRPLFYLAEARAGAGDWTRAEADYRAALELDAKSAACAAGLARALARQSRLDDAAVFYRRAAELDPEYQSALLELASLYEAARKPAEAMALYQKFPSNPAARERLGGLLLEAGKAVEALPHLEAAHAQSPTPASRLALATAYLRNKQPEKGLPLLEAAVAAEPENYDLRMLFGRAQRDQRQFAPAAREFFRATQLKPDSTEAWSELAGMLILLENYQQALAALDRLRAMGGETAAHHYFRAIILDRLKDFKPALESYQKFLAMSQNRNPDEEFKARQRIRIIQKELSKR